MAKKMDNLDKVLIPIVIVATIIWIYSIVMHHEWLRK